MCNNLNIFLEQSQYKKSLNKLYDSYSLDQGQRTGFYCVKIFRYDLLKLLRDQIMIKDTGLGFGATFQEDEVPNSLIIIPSRQMGPITMGFGYVKEGSAVMRGPMVT